MARTLTLPRPARAADEVLSTLPLRVDKWLWTARLFRTRALALEAVRGGHVRVDGATVRPSRLIGPGAALSIWHAGSRREVVVRATALRRLPARRVPELYEETAQSIARRAQERAERTLRVPGPQAGRPTKRARRAMGRFLRRA
jgi:ribosome-associated heat shock protein Hsp15